ncbi:hypothetical protein Ae201684P_009708 [Aphanomyces euteiches]|uniref:Uncharacterized protein n=1 Tax=Aphanomyces euteiches TaxID=100861 RepID=A0A6G0XGN3_9STRA|nr:hypothetical protein Ae201684_005029 [Aphanomyces euteiches]KAH9082383.1 hypothetical protein Ae201684P_009708 [Aphanomyces euteiches]
MDSKAMVQQRAVKIWTAPNERHVQCNFFSQTPTESCPHYDQRESFVSMTASIVPSRLAASWYVARSFLVAT